MLKYPIIIEKEKNPGENYRLVYVPDFDQYTEGDTITDCVNMAKDLIGLLCLVLDEDKNKNETFLISTPINEIEHRDSELVTVVEIDYENYKKKYGKKLD